MSGLTTNTRSLKTIGFFVLRVLLAVLFIGVGVAKLLGIPHMIREFATVGLGQWLRYVSGMMELCGSILLFWPGKIAYGAMLLCLVCVGAFFAQALRLHENIPHTIILFGILAAIAWYHRKQITA